MHPFPLQYESWSLTRAPSPPVLPRTQYDAKIVREYFPVDVVVAGVLKVYQTVLGLRFEEVKNPVSSKMETRELRWFNVSDAETERLCGRVCP